MSKLINIDSISEQEVVASFKYEGETYEMRAIPVGLLIQLADLENATDPTGVETIKQCVNFICKCFPTFPKETCLEMDPPRIYRILNHITERATAVTAEDEPEKK